MNPAEVVIGVEVGAVVPSRDVREGGGRHRMVVDQHGGQPPAHMADEVAVHGAAATRPAVAMLLELVDLVDGKVAVQVRKRDGKDRVLARGPIDQDRHHVGINVAEVVADEPRPVEPVERLNEVAVGAAMSAPELLNQCGLVVYRIQCLLHECSGKGLLHGYYTN